MSTIRDFTLKYVHLKYLTFYVGFFFILMEGREKEDREEEKRTEREREMNVEVRGGKEGGREGVGGERMNMITLLFCKGLGLATVPARKVPLTL